MRARINLMLLTIFLGRYAWAQPPLYVPEELRAVYREILAYEGLVRIEGRFPALQIWEMSLEEFVRRYRPAPTTSEPVDKVQSSLAEMLKNGKADASDWNLLRLVSVAILNNCAKYDVDARLVLAVIRAESNFNPTAVSKKGARSLTQLSRPTAEALGVDPDDIEGNIEGGVKYLAQLLHEFDGDLELTLAAYNAGPQAVKRYGGIPPFPETRQYVKTVLRFYQGEG